MIQGKNMLTSHLFWLTWQQAPLLGLRPVHFMNNSG